MYGWWCGGPPTAPRGPAPAPAAPRRRRHRQPQHTRLQVQPVQVVVRAGAVTAAVATDVVVFGDVARPMRRVVHQSVTRSRPTTAPAGPGCGGRSNRRSSRATAGSEGTPRPVPSDGVGAAGRPPARFSGSWSGVVASCWTSVADMAAHLRIAPQVPRHNSRAFPDDR
jgi:hypothetical protein